MEVLPSDALPRPRDQNQIEAQQSGFDLEKENQGWRSMRRHLCRRMTSLPWFDVPRRKAAMTAAPVWGPGSGAKVGGMTYAVEDERRSDITRKAGRRTVARLNFLSGGESDGETSRIGDRGVRSPNRILLPPSSWKTILERRIVFSQQME